MAAKNLYEDEMILVTGDWVDPTSDAHTIILKVPLLAALYPGVTAAHTTLKQALQPNELPRILAIIELEGKLDVRHDTIIRGAWNALTYMAELVGGAEGESLLALRDFLWPDGLASQQKSYAAEAGQADLLTDRFVKEPAMRKAADTTLIGLGSTAKPLGSYVDEYLQLAKQLGELETERGQILAAPSDNSARYQAVLGWIRVVNAMTANGELAQLDPQTEATVFGPFRNLEKKADERARDALNAAKKKAKEGEQTPKTETGTTAPATGTTTTPTGGTTTTAGTTTTTGGATPPATGTGGSSSSGSGTGGA